MSQKRKLKKMHRREMRRLREGEKMKKNYDFSKKINTEEFSFAQEN
jgi:hypothetical protein